MPWERTGHFFLDRETIPMRWRGLGCGTAWLAVAGILMLLPSTGWSQTSGTSSSGSASMAGVVIDAEGVLHTRIFSDPTGQVMRERIDAARATLDPKLLSYSKLRKISLNRLERAILDRQGSMDDDIVLAGPAEGWMPDLAGRIVGVTTGRPVVQLQDLVVALRMFPSGGSGVPVIGCSIDPTQEGQIALQQFNRSVHLQGMPSEEQIQMIAGGVRNSLGHHVVTINGVPSKTRFAQVLVEADYRMKLIGLGLERPPVRLISFVDRATPSDVTRLQRWYFVPDYQCVRQSEDGLAMELVGDGVKLIGEDEVVTASGQRKASASRPNKASQTFVSSFTKRYPELAERSPIYAELRNLIDLAVAAAYIQRQDFYGQADWTMPLFGSEKDFPVETYEVPKTVESAVNVMVRASSVSFPVGGGVQIEPTEALRADRLLPDEKDKVSKLRESIVPELAKGQWWWD